jgi:hypothetical protein
MHPRARADANPAVVNAQKAPPPRNLSSWLPIAPGLRVADAARARSCVLSVHLYGPNRFAALVMQQQDSDAIAESPQRRRPAGWVCRGVQGNAR